MKKLLLLLTIFIALACNGQSKTICEQVDSLYTVINSLKSQNVYLADNLHNISEELFKQSEITDSLLNDNENLIYSKSVLLEEITGISSDLYRQTKLSDSLSRELLLYKAAITELGSPTDTIRFNQDTISIQIYGNNKTITFLKQGEQINYYLTDGLHRIDLFYNDKQINEFFSYDKKSYWGVSTTLAIPVK